MARSQPSPCEGRELLSADEVGGLDWRGKGIAFDSGAVRRGSDRVFCSVGKGAPGAFIDDLGDWLAGRARAAGQPPAEIKPTLTADIAALPAALRAAQPSDEE